VSRSLNCAIAIPPLTACDLLQEVGGQSLEQRVLEALARKRCPKLMAALKRRDLPLADLTASWFPTLFTMALPPETAVRVWDCLFVEGPKVIFRVALALLKVRHKKFVAHGHGVESA
jgi:TBC1 domain family member 2A